MNLLFCWEKHLVKKKKDEKLQFCLVFFGILFFDPVRFISFYSPLNRTVVRERNSKLIVVLVLSTHCGKYSSTV